jgi:catechol 2,3-dioxygenase-like lactoylglutathione lyase family enzyme
LSDAQAILNPKKMHHASIRTANIHRAIAFYEQLGFTVCDRFTTGYTPRLLDGG